MLALQMDSQGESWLSFAIDSVTEQDNKYLGKWIKQRLNATMGTQSQRGPLVGMWMTRPGSQMLAHFAAELGKGVALGLKALGPLKTPLMAQGGTTDTDSKQLYGEEVIAALMGFSNFHSGSHLQDVWAYFNTSRRCNFMLPTKLIHMY
jgi:hypothetical protein